MSLSSWSHSMYPSCSSPSKRLVRSKSGLKIVAQHERHVAPWALEEPHWVTDKEVSTCIECNSKFDFIKRRHHCRRCGKIFCSKCCHSKVLFHRMGFVDPVRLCGVCAGVTKKEKEFFDKQLKALFAGAPFYIRSSFSISTESHLYQVKLAQDERLLIFDSHDGSGETINPVDLCRITASEPAKDDNSKSEEGDSKLTLTVRETATEEMEYTLTCPQEPSRKPSIEWIEAFKQGMMMVYESRSFCRDADETSNPSEATTPTSE